MSKKLKDFLKEIAEKAEIKSDNPELVSFLNAVADIDVPDAVTKDVDTRLISISSAKSNHKEIKDHYFATAYNGVDNEISNLMNELAVDDSIREIVNGEKSSTKKASRLVKELKTKFEAAKKPGAGDVEIESLRKTINDLKSALGSKDSEITKIKEDYVNEGRNRNKNELIRGMYSKYETTLKDMTPSAKDAAVMAMLNDALNTDSADIVYNHEANTVSLMKKDGTNFHGENNVIVPLDKYIEKVFVKNNVLLQNNSGGGQRRDNRSGNNSQQSRTNSRSQNDNNVSNETRLNSRAASMLNDAISGMSQGNTNSGPKML